jgi:hypothetical protein
MRNTYDLKPGVLEEKKKNSVLSFDWRLGFQNTNEASLIGCFTRNTVVWVDVSYHRQRVDRRALLRSK